MYLSSWIFFRGGFLWYFGFIDSNDPGNAGPLDRGSNQSLGTPNAPRNQSLSGVKSRVQGGGTPLSTHMYRTSLWWVELLDKRAEIVTNRSIRCTRDDHLSPIDTGL